MVQIIIVVGSRIFFPVASVSSFWPPIVNPHRTSQLRVLMISVKIIRTVAWSPVVGESVIKPIIVVHMVLPRVPGSVLIVITRVRPVPARPVNPVIIRWRIFILQWSLIGSLFLLLLFLLSPLSLL